MKESRSGQGEVGSSTLPRPTKEIRNIENYVIAHYGKGTHGQCPVLNCPHKMFFTEAKRFVGPNGTVMVEGNCTLHGPQWVTEDSLEIHGD